MNVLVDTSVWSLAFRRVKKTASHASVTELAELIRESRAEIIGPIRQEILSGIRDKHDFDELRKHLRAFPDLVLESEDYERAAEIFNTCRAHGIQGSNTDFLICAAAEIRKLSLLTTDKDFNRYAEHCKLEFHSPRQ
jgi:predicted nucleic acid-binding protein